MKKVVRSGGLALVLILLVGMIVSAIFPWETEHQMSAYNDHWNDVSSFRGALKAQGYEIGNIMSSPKVLEDQDDWLGTVLIITGVERPYTQEEIDAIGKFIERDGRVILADDYGYSGPLLQEFVGDVFLNGSTLYSSNYVKNPAFVRVSALVDREYHVLLNKPSAIQGTLPGHIISITDNRTWMDANENNEKDIEELEGIYVIGLKFANNIFLSDPSLFINDMWKREDNAAFALALVRDLLPQGGKVIFEESRHISSDTGARVQREVYDSLLFVAFDNWARGLIIAISLLSVMAYLRYVRLPSEWFHRDNLNEAWLMNYTEPFLAAEDNLRVKNLLENKVRVAAQMSPREFALKRKALIEKMLTDKDLVKFLTKWKTHSKAELEGALEKIKGWRPDPETYQKVSDKAKGGRG